MYDLIKKSNILSIKKKQKSNRFVLKFIFEEFFNYRPYSENLMSYIL